MIFGWTGLVSPARIRGVSMAPASITDFDDWLVETSARVGSFTMLIVLVEIGEKTVSALDSSYLHVIGDETRWTDMVGLLSGAGVRRNGAAFFSRYERSRRRLKTRLANIRQMEMRASAPYGVATVWRLLDPNSHAVTRGFCPPIINHRDQVPHKRTHT